MLTLRVGMHAEPGSYSDDAAHAMLGDAYESVAYRNAREAMRALTAREIDCAVLPVENSLVGAIGASYDALLGEAGIFAVRHTAVSIRHCLLGVPGADLESVRVVESHPVALAQCGAFLDRHPRFELHARLDTAGSAREVAWASDPARAAIASERVGRRHGLTVLASDIADRADNVTRFLLVANELPTDTGPGRARTLLVYSVANHPGALLCTLELLANRGANLLKIESRPLGAPWTYQFVVEFEHDGGLSAANAIVESMASRACNVRHIGTFSSFPNTLSP